MNQQTKPIDTEKILEILKRGNTAEIMYTKHGLTIFEVVKKIRCRKTFDR
jgi:hypothetical protein